MSKAPAAVVACITTKYQATRVAGDEVTAVNVSPNGRVRPVSSGWSIRAQFRS
jgi:hypothetical protein